MVPNKKVAKSELKQFSAVEAIQKQESVMYQYRDNELHEFIFSTSSSSDSEGSYDTNEALANTQFELTPQLREAARVLKQSFEDPKSVDPGALVSC